MMIVFLTLCSLFLLATGNPVLEENIQEFGECGYTTGSDISAFQSPMYPEPHSVPGECEFSIQKHYEICQIRLDFLDFNLAQPSTTPTDPTYTPTDPSNYGNCDTDMFYVAGNPLGNTFGPLCGFNTGQHVYVHVPKGDNVYTLKVILGDSAITRTWKIKVTMMTCDQCQQPYPDMVRAPDGCTQYFTGVAGVIRSFNYQETAGLATGVHLQNQKQVICIRTEPGFCSIQYTQENFGNFDSFGSFGVSSQFGPLNSGSGNQDCIQDFLIIPNGMDKSMNTDPNWSVADRFCGENLSTQSNSMELHSITTTIQPFTVTFISDGREEMMEVENGANGFRGFSLKYQQRPCAACAEI